MKKIFSPFLLGVKQKRGKGGRQETETALYIDFAHGSKYSSVGKLTTSGLRVLQASFCFSLSPIYGLRPSIHAPSALTGAQGPARMKPIQTACLQMLAKTVLQATAGSRRGEGEQEREIGIR